MRTLDPVTIKVPRLDSQWEELKAMGFWSGPTSNPEGCISCKGTGVIRSYDFIADEQVDYECNCGDQWDLYCAMLLSGIGGLYQRAIWADIDGQVPQQVLDAVVDYCENADWYLRSGRGLILRGTHGTGKTLLANLLAKKLLSLDYSVAIITFNNLVATYMSGWKDEAERKRYERYISADFLVLDEVKQRGEIAGTVQTLMDGLVRGRTAASKPTILTTNMTEADIKSFGQGVFGLMLETSKILEVTGEDFRTSDKRRRRKEIEEDLKITRPVALW